MVRRDLDRKRAAHRNLAERESAELVA
jgi:hypothetical protein